MNIKISISVLTLVISTLGLAAFTPQPANAARSHKVDICHANNGNGTGGYNTINVDDDSVDGQGGNGDHNRSGHQDGRDIIPPFYDDGTPGYWSSRNWDAVGMATFYNNCNAPKVATASVSTIAATCDMAEQLAYGAINNATFSGTADGTFGPGSYDVTATANPDSLFNGNATSQVFSGVLAGITPTQSTNPEAPCYEAPELLTATASVSTEPATCEAAEKLVYGTPENASFDSDNSTPDGTFGPGSYDVTALADEGAEFEGGLTSLSFIGVLAGKKPAQGTDPAADCYFTPGKGSGEPTPAAPVTPAPAPSPAPAAAPRIAELPNTAGASTPVIVAGAALVAAFAVTLTSIIKFSIVSRL